MLLVFMGFFNTRSLITWIYTQTELIRGYIMQRSRGLKSRSRKKMTKVQRPGRTNPITNRLQRFEEGDLVHITINPSIQKGQPAPRFHGKTGKIVGQKGKAYLVALKDGNKPKELIVRPDHLKLQN